MTSELIYKFQKYLTEAAKATEKKPTKEVDEINSKVYDYQDPKLFNNINPDQLLNGVAIEIRKDNSMPLEKAMEIVVKQLGKDPMYYIENAAFGVEGIGYETLKQQEEIKGKYKSSGYGDLKENKMSKSEDLKELLEEAVAGIPSIGNPFAERKTSTYEDKFAAFLNEEKKDTKEAEDPKMEEGEAAYEYEKGKDAGKKMNEMEPKMKEEKDPKKEGKMKFEEVVKKVEKLGEMAKNKVAMEVYGAKKRELEETLGRINEDANLAEFIDEGKKNAVVKEIALYEKYCMNAEANYNNNK